MKREKRPLYVQIADQIKVDFGGSLANGTVRLPSEVGLAEKYGVSRTTVREALRLLEREGIVRSRHGVGNFMSSEHGSLSYTFDVLTGLSSILAAAGGKAETRLVKLTQVRISQEMRTLFSWPGDFAVELDRIRLLNGTPIAFSVDIAPSAYIGDVLDEDRISRSFFEALERNGYKPHRAESRLKAIMTPASVAEHMPNCKGRPIIFSQEMVYDAQERVIAVSRDYLNTQEIELVIRRAAIR